MPRRLTSWVEIGRRVAEARLGAGLTQQDLADEIGLDRTAISRLESGDRAIDTIELSRLSEVLGRSFEWFVTSSPPSVVSRRASSPRKDPSDYAKDALLEALCSDVELLGRLGVLSLKQIRIECTMTSVQDAERAAALARTALDASDGPLRNLLRLAEGAGLVAFALPFAEKGFDGSYVSLPDCGVAVINGNQDSGRRRFTMAHELGHHMLADAYSDDWDVTAGSGEHERLINAFAIHFLMPRTAIEAKWREFAGREEPAYAALRISAEFGISWSAACAQLSNLDLVALADYKQLAAMRPTRADYFERGLEVIDDLAPPQVPPLYRAAVIRAFRKHKISLERAMELLRGTVSGDDLATRTRVPLDSLRRELDPFE